MATCLVHGTMHARAVTSIACWAWISLLVFSCAGYLLGLIASRTIEESVRATIAAELAAEGSVAGEESS